MLENRLNRNQIYRNVIEYGGGLFLILHLLGNKFKISKSTPWFIIVPPVASFIIKVYGYFSIDRYA